MRLTDLIRGAKAVSKEPKSEDEKDKALQIAPSPELTDPVVQGLPSTLVHPPVETSTIQAPRSVPPVAAGPVSYPEQPLAEERAVVSTPVSGGSTKTTSPAPDRTAIDARMVPIQVKAVQSIQRDSAISQDAETPQIELRSLGRLTRKPGPSLPKHAESSVHRSTEQLMARTQSLQQGGNDSIRSQDAAPPLSIPAHAAYMSPMVPKPEPVSDHQAARTQTVPADPSTTPELPKAMEAASKAQLDVPEPQKGIETDWYAMAERELTRVGSMIKNRQPIAVAAVGEIATGIVDALDRSDQLLAKAFSAHQRGPFVITNMVNVGILSVKLGRGLGYQREDLIRLAMAGLLHDVGMFLIPESIVTKPEKLGAQDLAVIRQHPDFGYQILTSLGTQYDWLSQVAWQEHERSSGRGYPRGIRESQIHDYARIVGLADVFEALLSPRPHRPRLLPHVAMRELLSNEKQSFPHPLMKILVEQFSVFPLGTTVRLNTGEMAIVTQLNPRHPLRPVVQVMQLPDRTAPLELKIVDLSKTTLIHVAVVEVESRVGSSN